MYIDSRYYRIIKRFQNTHIFSIFHLLHDKTNILISASYSKKIKIIAYLIFSNLIIIFHLSIALFLEEIKKIKSCPKYDT